MPRCGRTPALGFEHAKRGVRFYYAELQRDFPLGERWVVISALAAGFFQDGPDLNLDHGLQFRTAAALAYRVRDRWRIGFSFAHISNAGLGEHNPGTEEFAAWISQSF